MYLHLSCIAMNWISQDLFFFTRLSSVLNLFSHVLSNCLILLNLCRNHEKEDFTVQSANFAPSHLCFKRQNFVLLPFSPISDFPSSLIADRPSLPMFLHKATMYWIFTPLSCSPISQQASHVLSHSKFLLPCSPIADLPCSFTRRPCIESLPEQEVKTF